MHVVQINAKVYLETSLHVLCVSSTCLVCSLFASNVQTLGWWGRLSCVQWVLVSVVGSRLNEYGLHDPEIRVSRILFYWFNVLSNGPIVDTMVQWLVQLSHGGSIGHGRSNGPIVGLMVQLSVQCSNGGSNGAMVDQMVQWSVRWSNGRSNGPMVGSVVPCLVQGSNGRSNGPLVGPMV